MLSTVIRFRTLLSAGCCLALSSGLAGQMRRSDFPPPEGRPGAIPAEYSQRYAQRISGPVLGFVFEKQEGLKPILGIPGAATIGQAVPGVPDIGAVVASVERDYALAIAAEDRRLLLVRNISGPAPVVSATAVPAGVDDIAMSPGGSAAALYYREAGLLRVLKGLPDTVSTSWSYDARLLPGPLAALAVSDDGDAVLAATGDGDQRTIVLLAPEQQWRYLTTAGAPASIAFLGGSSDAVIADGGANQVFLIRDVTGAAAMIPLAGEAEGVSRPVAVAASADNRRVVIANSDPGGIISVGLEGGDVEAVACRCVPTGLHRLNGKSVFRLNEPSRSQLYVFDGDSPESRIVFVPPSAASRDTEGGSQ